MAETQDAPIEAEVVPDEADNAPGSELTRSQAPAPVPGYSTALIAAGSPDEMLATATKIATALDGVIKQRELFQKIGKKDHLLIEAWQTLATLLGAAPIIRYTRRVIDPTTGKPELVEYPVEVTDYEWFTENGKKKKREKAKRTYTVSGYNWEAACDVVKDGVIIASAESMVSRTEDRWAKADDYAVRSMAQTRAQSRAIAAAARWVVTLAGYSGTPAEEMAGVEQEQAAEPALPHGPKMADEHVPAVVDALTKLLTIDSAQPATTVAKLTWDELVAWAGYPSETVAAGLIKAAKRLDQLVAEVDAQEAAAAPDADPTTNEEEA